MEYSTLLTVNVLNNNIEEDCAGRINNIEHHTPYRDEIRLFSCIQQGNLEMLMKEIKNFYQRGGIFVGKVADNDTKQYKYLAVSTITLATRYAIQGGLPEETAYKFSDDFIMSLEKITSAKDIMEYIASKIIQLTNMVNDSKTRIKYSPHIRKCILYINDNLNKKLSVKIIADNLGLTADYISQLFKKEVGENLSDYILKKKLETAKIMIQNGLDNSQICYSLGFSSQSHFISVFKKYYNMTPREYALMLK